MIYNRDTHIFWGPLECYNVLNNLYYGRNIDRVECQMSRAFLPRNELHASAIYRTAILSVCLPVHHSRHRCQNKQIKFVFVTEAINYLSNIMPHGIRGLESHRRNKSTSPNPRDSTLNSTLCCFLRFPHSTSVVNPVRPSQVVRQSSGVTRVGVTRGGNWRCYPYFFLKKWRPF